MLVVKPAQVVLSIEVQVLLFNEQLSPIENIVEDVKACIHSRLLHDILHFDEISMLFKFERHDIVHELLELFWQAFAKFL